MAKLGAATPFFIVTSFAKSVKFYVEQLGFEIRFQSPEDKPFFAIVGRDSASLMLKEILPETKPIPNSSLHEWARWDAFVYVKEPDALFDEFSRSGVAFQSELANDEEDEIRGFELKDPDGYVLYFGRPIDEAS